jgi:hypothetical protein
MVEAENEVNRLRAEANKPREPLSSQKRAAMLSLLSRWMKKKPRPAHA